MLAIIEYWNILFQDVIIDELKKCLDGVKSKYSEQIKVSNNPFYLFFVHYLYTTFYYTVIIQVNID